MSPTSRPPGREKMKLLDLPPEMFTLIIREAVRTAGIDESWKQRLVCKSFAGVIYDEVIRKLDIAQLSNSQCIVRLLGEELSVRKDLLTARIASPQHAGATIPYMVNTFATFFAQEIQGADSRDEYVLRLCNFIAGRFTLCLEEDLNLNYEPCPSCPSIRLLLKLLKPNTHGVTVPVTDRLAVAAVVNSPALFKMTLQRCLQLDEISWVSDIFGAPIATACQFGYTGIIEELTTYARNLPHGLNQHRILTRHLGYYLSIEIPIDLAIRNGHKDAISKMIHLHHECNWLNARVFNIWLIRATKPHSPDMLDFILTAASEWKATISQQAFIAICAMNHPTHIKRLSELGFLRPNTPFVDVRHLRRPNVSFDPDLDNDMSPLCIAIDSGHPAIVAAILDAGADIDGVENPAYNYPIHTAIQKGNPAIVELLLERGASLRGLEAWEVAADTRSEVIYGIIKEAYRRIGEELPPLSSVPPPIIL